MYALGVILGVISGVIPVVLVYAGFLAMLVGAASLVKPLAFLRILNRRRAAAVLVGGLVSVAIGMFLPASETRVVVGRTHLDEFAPVYQFNEVHKVRVNAPRARVYQAIEATTADEILLFRTLTWIRRLGRQGPANVPNAPERLPILNVATRTSFLLLAEEPNREIVVGTVVLAPNTFRPRRKLLPDEFRNIREPGWALATMNLWLDDAGGDACIVRTETRVYATDPAAKASFARYWRVIYPGSALIRRMWLRAIKRRAESAIREGEAALFSQTDELGSYAADWSAYPHEPHGPPAR